jgi:hypothetical protein
MPFQNDLRLGLRPSTHTRIYIICRRWPRQRQKLVKAIRQYSTTIKQNSANNRPVWNDGTLVSTFVKQTDILTLQCCSRTRTREDQVGTNLFFADRHRRHITQIELEWRRWVVRAKWSKKQVKLCCFIILSIALKWVVSNFQIYLWRLTNMCVRGRADRWYTCSYFSCPAILDALRGDNWNMVSEIRTSDGFVNATKYCHTAGSFADSCAQRTRFSQWTSQTICPSKNKSGEFSPGGFKNIAENLNSGTGYAPDLVQVTNGVVAHRDRGYTPTPHSFLPQWCI